MTKQSAPQNQRDAPQDLFDLDSLRLDEAWAKQAQFVYDYGTQVANARDLYERHKRRRDLKTAEIDLAIRRNPQAFGLDKITESAIASRVLLHEEVGQTEQRVLAAKHRLDILQAILHALEDRRKALENRVQLWSQGYFAEPRAPEGTQEKMTEMSKRWTRNKGREKCERT